MLQRIYGTAFLDKKELKAHLQMLEERKERDHRKIGKEFKLCTNSQLVRMVCHYGYLTVQQFNVKLNVTLLIKKLAWDMTTFIHQYLLMLIYTKHLVTGITSICRNYSDETERIYVNELQPKYHL